MSRALILCAATVFIVSTAIAQKSDSLRLAARPATAPADTLRPALIDTEEVRSAAIQYIRRDSLLRYNYRDAGEALTLAHGISMYSLGVSGAPSWTGMHGSLPVHQRISRNGIAITDPMTFLPRWEMAAMEDASAIIVYPMHQAFWYGGTGALATAEIVTPVRNSPHPETRLRHMFGPYDYLYTDVDFSLNTGVADNFAAGLTRQSYGSGDAGRFRNTTNERWNVRLEYRSDLNERLSIKIADWYNDHYTHINGGIEGTINADSTAFIYPDPDTEPFRDTAFSAILAQLFNSTIYLREQSNTVYGEGSYRWFGNSSMITTARLGFHNGARLYRDEGVPRNDSLAWSASRLQTTRKWSNIFFEAMHSVNTGWAQLELAGAMGGWQFRDGGGYYQLRETMTSMGKASLRFALDAFRLQILGRLENTYWQYTYGAGTTVETDLTDELTLWAGLSTGTRPYSLFETQYINRRTLGSAGAEPDYEHSIIAEAGLRYNSQYTTSSIAAFFRKSSQSLLVTGQIHTGDRMFSRYAWKYSLIDETAEYYGFSGSVCAQWWIFGADVKGTMLVETNTGALAGYNLTPEWQGSAGLFVRANKNLIETLDLKTGASVEYAGEYTPLLFLPEDGVFAVPSLLSPQTYTRKYTGHLRLDLYLYATIRDTATLHLVLYNALDERYITTGFYPMPERGLQFGVDWKFLD